jgi:hypothetical protein
MKLEAWSYLWDRRNHAYRLMRVPGRDGDEIDCCLIVDLWAGTMELIEDNALSRSLKERMRAEGVPIIEKGERVTWSVPPVQSVLDDFEEGRITMEACNERRRALANDHEARRAWIRENGLDR